MDFWATLEDCSQGGEQPWHPAARDAANPESETSKEDCLAGAQEGHLVLGSGKPGNHGGA